MRLVNVTGYSTQFKRQECLQEYYTHATYIQIYGQRHCLELYLLAFLFRSANPIVVPVEFWDHLAER